MALLEDDNKININFYYFNLYLNNSKKSLGQYSIVDNNEIIGTLSSLTLNNFVEQTNNYSFDILVTGLTTSKLNQVKTYNNELIIGVNGVEEINEEYVLYKIDNITYKTFLDSDLTTYSLIKKTNEFDNNFLVKNDNVPYIDIKKILNGLLIDRSNLSIYDYFNKISNTKGLDDIIEIFE